MRLSFRRLVFILSSTVPVAAAHGQNAKFDMRPIAVGGVSNVQATGINNHGSIAAAVYRGRTYAQSAVVLNGWTATTLPLPDAAFGPLTPTAINQAGDVVGWARRTSDGVPNLFLYQNGVYNPLYNFPVAAISQTVKYLIPNPIGVNGRLKVFFTYVIGMSLPTIPEYGVPPKLHYVPHFNRFTTIESLNSSGTVAGIGYSLSGPVVVFVGKGKTYQTLTPPGAISTKGGFVDDKGAVAGTYYDAQNTPHGFVYDAGTYATFDMPEAAASIEVTGINKAGHVAGAYTSAASGKQLGFLYNGSAVSTFGSFARSDNLIVKLNDRGAMVVAAQRGGANPDYRSYQVSCSGRGC